MAAEHSYIRDQVAEQYQGQADAEPGPRPLFVRQRGLGAVEQSFQPFNERVQKRMEAIEDVMSKIEASLSNLAERIG